MELPSSWKVQLFTGQLIVGLILSQMAGAWLDKGVYDAWVTIITGATMWCLSFIMINVGYEFTIDKDALVHYFWDYCIAMTAAGFPWVFIGLWYYYALGVDMPFDESLLIARFAAPTSAGILFSMLDAAGLKETWVFNKARILAIFDDLDTIILMIPLKILMVGIKWELSVSITIMVVLLGLAWRYLHKLKLPYDWRWTLLYAAIVAGVCKAIYKFSDKVNDMDAIHIEVLLPAFVIGTLVDTHCARVELEHQRTLRSLSFARSHNDSRSTTFGKNIVKCDPSQNIKTEGNARFEEKGENVIIRSTNSAMTMPRQSLGKATVVAPQSPNAQASTARAAWGAQGGQPASSASTLNLPPQETPIDELFIHEISKQSFGNVSNASSKSNGSKHKRRNCHSPSKRSEASNTSHSSTGSKRMTRYGLAVDSDRAPVKEFLPEVLNDVVPRHHDVSKVEAAKGGSQHSAHSEPWDVEEVVNTVISAVFMLLVGLAMPALIGNNAEDNSGGLSGGTIALHIFLVTILMILGKMFPIVCYKQEVNFKQRLGLCLGMCPRGEVGASIIVISLELGIKGPSVIISMCALGINLVMSGVFIFMVKYLVKDAGSMFEGADLEGGPSPKGRSSSSPAKPLDDRVLVEDFEE
jgi:Kef-type K+ transport system membrane component KefB